MHHPTDRITHNTSFVTPVVEHWLKREIVERPPGVLLTDRVTEGHVCLKMIFLCLSVINYVAVCDTHFVSLHEQDPTANAACWGLAARSVVS